MRFIKRLGFNASRSLARNADCVPNDRPVLHLMVTIAHVRSGNAKSRLSQVRQLQHGGVMSADDEFLEVNCGRCGKKLLARVESLADKRWAECERCCAKPPFSIRPVYVVFETSETWIRHLGRELQ